MGWKDGEVNYQSLPMLCDGCGRRFDRRVLMGVSPSLDPNHFGKVVELGEWTIDDFHRHGKWTCPYCKGTFRKEDELVSGPLQDVMGIGRFTLAIWDEVPA